MNIDTRADLIELASAVLLGPALCIIPARANSQRLPGKNIRPLFGKPVIAYSIELAIVSKMFSDVIVSTDADEIEEIAIHYGANTWRRPLDDGTRGTQEVAAEVLRKIPPASVACVLYPVAPLLTIGDLRDGLTYLRRNKGLFAFAVGTDPLRDAGAMYWGFADAFRAGKPLINPRSIMIPLPENRVCDVNTQSDWDELERKFAKLYGLEVL